MVRRIALLIMIVSALGRAAHAAAAEFTVLDKSGEPLADAIVWFAEQSASVSSLHTMDQIDRQFVPHVLVVPRGSQVEFPNSDSIMHHVYSFSPAKTFEIKLYKDRAGEPLTFDRAGVVQVGCNIHDWMLAYILVIDGDQFARTDADGRAQLPIGDEVTSVNVWHSRFQSINSPERFSLNTSGPGQVLQLHQKLSPPLAPYGADEFDGY